MARHTPSSSGPITKLADWQPYPAKIVGVDLGDDNGFGTPLRVTLQLSQDVDDTLRVQLGIRLGKQQNGKPSALRAFLNALAGKAAHEPVAGFDDETFEADWADGTRLTVAPGMYVTIIGQSAPGKSDPSKSFYNVESWQPVRGQVGSPAPAPSSAPAPQAPPAAFPPSSQMPRPAPTAGDETNPDMVPF